MQETKKSIFGALKFCLLTTCSFSQEVQNTEGVAKCRRGLGQLSDLALESSGIRRLLAELAA